MEERGVVVAESRGWRLFALALALAFVVLLFFAKQAPLIRSVDRGIMLWVGEVRPQGWGEQATLPALLLTIAGDTIGRLLFTFGICAWFYRRGRLRHALWLIGVVVGASILNGVLKDLFALPRPKLIPHLDPIRSYSYPSGHASGNMAFLGAVALLFRRRWLWVPAVCLAIAIGLSRVWLGVHWPTDVLGGWVLGLGWLAGWSAIVPLRFPSPGDRMAGIGEGSVPES